MEYETEKFSNHPSNPLNLPKTTQKKFDINTELCYTVTPCYKAFLNFPKPHRTRLLGPRSDPLGIPSNSDHPTPLFSHPNAPPSAVLPSARSARSLASLLNKITIARPHRASLSHVRHSHDVFASYRKDYIFLLRTPICRRGTHGRREKDDNRERNMRPVRTPNHGLGQQPVSARRGRRVL